MDLINIRGYQCLNRAEETTSVKKRITILTIVLAATLAAQPGVDAIKSYLNLTDAQIQTMQQIGRQRDMARQTAADQIQQKDFALRDMLQRGGADATAVGRLMLEIESLRKGEGQTENSFRE